MKISIWGLGYVGTVLAGCFAQEGHEAIGVTIVDFVRISESRSISGVYKGICW